MIHPSAIVDPKCELAENVSIGPYTVIGPDVSIGANSVIGSNVVMDKYVSIGEDCRIYQFASVGAPPQAGGLLLRSVFHGSDRDDLLGAVELADRLVVLAEPPTEAS